MQIADRFPILFGTITERGPAGYRTARVIEKIEALEAAKAAGSITNPVYADIKHVLGRVIEDAWDAVRRTVEPRHGEAPEAAMKFAWDIAFINGGIHGWHKAIKKKLDKAPALPEVEGLVRAANAFVAEVAPIADAFAFFAADKSRIVKRQPKAEGGDPRFVAPPASTEASKKVKAMLEGLVADQFTALVASLTRIYQNQIAAFVAKRDARVAEIAASDKPNRRYRLLDYLRETPYANASFLSQVLGDDDHGRGTPQVRKDASEIVAKIALTDAEEIRDAFVAKNLRKIVSIVEAKEQQSAMESCKALSHTVSLGGLEGAFVVVFKDGSSFRFHNAAVFKINSYGTRFCQYPLTFHNVVLADGSKMGRPSEKRMNAVFLGKSEEEA